MITQLCPIGRAATSSPKDKVMSPSAISIDPNAEPLNQMTEAEIHNPLAIFAIVAGFDGLEIHGAKWFYWSASSPKTSLISELVRGEAVLLIDFALARKSPSYLEAIGAEKVGYRTSPFSDFWAMRMENPESQFKHLVTELAKV